MIVLELLEATSRFDGPLGVRRNIGGLDLALFGFAVRGRRLLRAVCRLLDANEPDCASPLLRVMNEYVIVGRWLISAGDKRMQAWALDDLRDRRNTIDEVMKLTMTDDEPVDLGAELKSTEDAIRNYAGPDAALTKRAGKKAGEPATPGLQAMAREVDLEFAYSFAYRLQSQTDVHATPLSIDAVFEVDSTFEPGPKLRDVPANALRSYDLYRAGGHLLIDLLRPVVDRIPELGWGSLVEETSARLLQTAALERS